ncbi:CGNR zinc finger domain-containing protein [Plantactinospora siamensis]|uniref:CGNR zinc finger domain-containing protein n=1 Tax=Plantactinospora siamensis TaxID=555372 RepID=A0ABV6NRF2_9ACTN
MRQPGDRAPAPEPLALVQDLINTNDIEGRHDRLTEPAGLRGFCADHGLPDPGATAEDLAEVRRFRELLREVCAAHTGADLPVAERSALAELTARAPLVLAVGPDGTVRAAPAASSGTAALLGRICAEVLAAEAAGTWRRLKACAAHGCRWVYYDHSPAGRGRWCTMSMCGSRAKMRSYRAGRAGGAR